MSAMAEFIDGALGVKWADVTYNPKGAPWAIEAIRRLIDREKDFLNLHTRAGGPFDVKRVERPHDVYEAAELADMFAQAEMNRYLQYGLEIEQTVEQVLLAKRVVELSLEWQDAKWRLA